MRSNEPRAASSSIWRAAALSFRRDLLQVGESTTLHDRARGIATSGWPRRDRTHFLTNRAVCRSHPGAELQPMSIADLVIALRIKKSQAWAQLFFGLALFPSTLALDKIFFLGPRAQSVPAFVLPQLTGSPCWPSASCCSLRIAPIERDPTLCGRGTLLTIVLSCIPCCVLLRAIAYMSALRRAHEDWHHNPGTDVQQERLHHVPRCVLLSAATADSLIRMWRRASGVTSTGTLVPAASRASAFGVTSSAPCLIACFRESEP